MFLRFEFRNATNLNAFVLKVVVKLKMSIVILLIFVFSVYVARNETMMPELRNIDTSTSWHNSVVNYLCRRHISHLFEFIWNSMF